MFHEWLLERPSDILQVHFLIQNIDRWTVGKFRDRVISGVNDLVEAVVQNKTAYKPWRRCGDLGGNVLAKINKENVTPNISASTASTAPPPPRAKGKSRMR
jgi:solute carrier family 25 carnitine/acylcarnitine transporter 20/29